MVSYQLNTSREKSTTDAPKTATIGAFRCASDPHADGNAFSSARNPVRQRYFKIPPAHANCANTSELYPREYAMCASDMSVQDQKNSARPIHLLLH
jgi:hypothetical protein